MLPLFSPPINDARFSESYSGQGVATTGHPMRAWPMVNAQVQGAKMHSCLRGISTYITVISPTLYGSWTRYWCWFMKMNCTELCFIGFNIMTGYDQRPVITQTLVSQGYSIRYSQPSGEVTAGYNPIKTFSINNRLLSLWLKPSNDVSHRSMTY